MAEIKDKEKEIPILIILLLIINIITVGINMHDQIAISLGNQWGQIAFRNAEEERKWHEDNNRRQRSAEAAKARLAKYEQFEQLVSVLCSIGAIILTILALRKKKNVQLHVVCTILILFGTVILLF